MLLVSDRLFSFLRSCSLAKVRLRNIGIRLDSIDHDIRCDVMLVGVEVPVD